MTESKAFTIVSDGVVLAPYQMADGVWGWYVVEFLMDSREYLNGEEVLVNLVAPSPNELIADDFSEEK